MKTLINSSARRSWCFILLVCACALDTFGVSGTQGSASTSGTTASTTLDGPTTQAPLTSGTSTGAPPVCGDGVVEAPEICDDGNHDGADGCAEDCTWEPCKVLWEKPYKGVGGNTFEVRGESVFVWPEDGSIVVSGQLSIGANSRAGWLARYTAEGDLLWHSQIHPDVDSDTTARALSYREIDGHHEFIVAGRMQGATGWDAWLNAYDPDGSLLWSARYDSPDGSVEPGSGCLAFDANGNGYVGGERSGLWLARFPGDPMPNNVLDEMAFDWQFAKNMEPGWSRLGAVDWTSKGDIVACGYLNGMDGEPSLGTLWFAQIEPASGFILNDMSDASIGPYTSIRCAGLAVGNGDEVILAAEASDSVNEATHTAWVQKFDESGDPLWPEPVVIQGDGVGQNVAADVAVAADGSILVAATITNQNTGLDGVVRKYSGDDPPVLLCEWPWITPGLDQVESVAVSPDGTIAAVGRRDGEIWVARLTP